MVLSCWYTKKKKKNAIHCFFPHSSISQTLRDMTQNPSTSGVECCHWFSHNANAATWFMVPLLTTWQHDHIDDFVLLFFLFCLFGFRLSFVIRTSLNHKKNNIFSLFFLNISIYFAFVTEILAQNVPNVVVVYPPPIGCDVPVIWYFTWPALHAINAVVNYPPANNLHWWRIGSCVKRTIWKRWKVAPHQVTVSYTLRSYNYNGLQHI